MVFLILTLLAASIQAFSTNHNFLSERVAVQCRSIPSSRLKMMQIWWDGRDIDNEKSNTQASDNIPAFLRFQLAEDPDVLLMTEHSSRPEVFSVDEGNVITDKIPIFKMDSKKDTFESGIVLDSKTGNTVGKLVDLEDAAGQDEAMAALGSVEWIVVQTSVATNWQMIPAENLIAAAQASGTKLAFCIDKVGNVGGLSRALELGVDALCVNAAIANDNLWREAFEARRERNKNVDSVPDNISTLSNANLPVVVVGKCWRREIQGTILADRICVDFVQMLLPEEGIWVGSSAKIKVLVLSEAASSLYVPTRPFRVNAGPVHSYVLMSDNTTKYLSELQPGDQVEVYNAINGNSRSVAVGRLKQEIRPCVLVELEAVSGDDIKVKHHSGQVFLQQAETVRLAQEKGSFIRVTDLESISIVGGTKFKNIGGKALEEGRQSILLRITTAGTHVGKTYTGNVEER
uniref:3-dehydroquinate synthase n=1 Tax=Chaetoceros debilis TaxID=122233 RepID=A0A7S3V4H9_9STRA